MRTQIAASILVIPLVATNLCINDSGTRVTGAPAQAPNAAQVEDEGKVLRDLVRELQALRESLPREPARVEFPEFAAPKGQPETGPLAKPTRRAEDKRVQEGAQLQATERQQWEELVRAAAEKAALAAELAAKQAASQAPAAKGREWTTIEIVLSVGVLVFGILILVLLTLIVIKVSTGWTPRSIIRAYCVPLIIVVSVLLITAGYSSEQASPVIGLLGTIAGYLIGSWEAGNHQSDGETTE